MAVQPIQSVTPFMKIEGADNQKMVAPGEAQQNFSSFLNESIQKLNQASTESASMTDKLIRGENVDLHQVLIASQKSSVTTQLALEVRNKAVEAYQEIMRMQL